MDTPKTGKNVVYGTIMESLPNTLFRVKIDGGGDDLVLSFLGGKMIHNRIRVVIGDKVMLEIDPYGGKARITRRM
ncbi:MAG: translation initiation factor IF-1 [Candidatus Pacebacteria bacterium]|jgi:translation initiation factor IF-1|nr:translation initiation factor IF-1 [Candidatus Paceibacterota bacterium]MBP9818736.1 translation initiation factor IF-1 [Candidatus Paceibacterota bacterium]